MTYKVVERVESTRTSVYAFEGLWFWCVLVKGHGFRKGWAASAVGACDQARKVARHYDRTGKLL